MLHPCIEILHNQLKRPVRHTPPFVQHMVFNYQTWDLPAAWPLLSHILSGKVIACSSPMDRTKCHRLVFSQNDLNPYSQDAQLPATPEEDRRLNGK